MCVSAYASVGTVPWEARRGPQSFGAGVTVGCEPLKVSAGI